MWEAILKALGQQQQAPVAAQPTYTIAPSVADTMTQPQLQPERKIYLDPKKTKEFEKSLDKSLGFYGQNKGK